MPGQSPVGDVGLVACNIVNINHTYLSSINLLALRHLTRRTEIGEDYAWYPFMRV